MGSADLVAGGVGIDAPPAMVLAKSTQQHAYPATERANSNVRFVMVSEPARSVMALEGSANNLLMKLTTLFIRKLTTTNRASLAFCLVSCFGELVARHSFSALPSNSGRPNIGTNQDLKPVAPTQMTNKISRALGKINGTTVHPKIVISAKKVTVKHLVYSGAWISNTRLVGEMGVYIFKEEGVHEVEPGVYTHFVDGGFISGVAQASDTIESRIEYE